MSRKEISWGLLTSCLIALASSGQEVESRIASDARSKSVDYGRQQVKDVPDQAFVAVSYTELPKAVRGAMYGWLGVLVPTAVNPHAKDPLQSGRMGVRVFAADRESQDDLVEYRWNQDNRDIRVLASRNAIRFDFDLLQMQKDPARQGAGNTARDRVDAGVRATLRFEGTDLDGNPYRILLPWPTTLEDGASFSTNGERDLNRLTRWHERVDGFITKDKACILVYTKPAQLMHFQDGSTWFPDDFRGWVHAKAREQGRILPTELLPGE